MKFKYYYLIIKELLIYNIFSLNIFFYFSNYNYVYIINNIT